ncbi:hypothetical protein AGMMS50262_19470 [Bacteroidia bacterium]|nr:hypothetical protein AGMMS50262_19470 [Bacteroidia bacterium]
MIFKFILVSEEVGNFRRDIIIDADATFYDLHEAILSSVGYAKDQMTSFFICDDDWVKGTEITLMDMGSGADEDVYVMDGSRLRDLLEEEHQKLIYVFEPLTERCFFMELKEIIPVKNQEKAEVVKSTGHPPKQVSLVEEMDFSAPKPTAKELDDFDDFGDDEFNLDEYDDEDFGDLTSDTNPFDNY